MKQTVLASVVTFGVFFTEALIHYNYGILETKHGKFSWDTFFETFTFPKGKSLLKMASLVGVAALVSGKIISHLDK